MAGSSSGNSGGRAGAGGGNGSVDLLKGVYGETTHPRGLLDAIGHIEQAYADESGGAIIDPLRLTTPVRIEFMEVGGRGSILSGFVMVLLSPLAVGVLEHYIPIFGSYTPSAFDQFCGVLLALIFPLCYSLLFASAATKHLGGYSRAMVSSLLQGMAMASFFKAAVVFLAFHVFYFKVLTDQNISRAIQKLYMFKLPYETALSMFVWIKDFRHVFITCSYFIALSTLIFVTIPYMAFYWAHLRNKKLIDAGVVNVFQENQ